MSVTFPNNPPNPALGYTVGSTGLLYTSNAPNVPVSSPIKVNSSQFGKAKVGKYKRKNK